MSECTCNGRFLDPEDYRSHLPCRGTLQQQEIAALTAVLRKLPQCESDKCDRIATVRFVGLGGIDEYRCDTHRVRVDFDLPYATELRVVFALWRRR